MPREIASRSRRRPSELGAHRRQGDFLAFSGIPVPQGDDTDADAIDAKPAFRIGIDPPEPRVIRLLAFLDHADLPVVLEVDGNVFEETRRTFAATVVRAA